jgi:hypothetical protein
MTYDEFIGQLQDNLFELYVTTGTKAWLDWPVEEQADLRAQVAKLNEVAGQIRQAFDQAVWDGHDSGVVSTDIESIRARIVSDKTPGRKAKTVEEKAAELFS